MAACFRCRIRKLSCSGDSPTCRQCRLASINCKYQDTATEASNSPPRLSENCPPPNSQTAEEVSLYPSIEGPQAGFVDFDKVLWRKCFVESPRNTMAVLLENANELVTGQSEQTSTIVDISKKLRFPLAADVALYNANCGDLRDTPPVERTVNLQLSPSPPPAVPPPHFSPDSSPEPAESGNRHKKSKISSNWTTHLLQFLWRSASQLPCPNRPSQAYNVLVSFMDNGRTPDIARIAGLELLASGTEKYSAAKQVLMLATRLRKKMALKVGQIGWRKRKKTDTECEIEDEAEKGFEERPWEEIGELTKEDLEACIEHDFENKIERGVEHDVGGKPEKGASEGVWKESMELGRGVLREELRKGLRKGLRKELRRAFRKRARKGTEEDIDGDGVRVGRRLKGRKGLRKSLRRRLP